MAHELHSSEPAGEGIRRLARERLQLSVERLDDRDEEVVHDVRKECKQVRGLLRLVRAELGDALYRRENQRLRDLARPLSEFRDAQALIAAFDALLGHFRKELRPGVFAPVKRALEGEYQRRKRAAMKERQSLGRARSELQRALREARSWPLGGKGWGALSPGLRRTYALGRKAMRRAEESRADDDLHEWRKQAKYLRAELDALGKMWPAPLEALSDDLHQLSDLLGDDHDLAVLAQKFDAELAEVLPDEGRAALLGLLFRRRDELQREALKLGRKLYAERPRLLIDGLREHWRAWHTP